MLKILRKIWEIMRNAERTVSKYEFKWIYRCNRRKLNYVWHASATKFSWNSLFVDQDFPQLFLFIGYSWIALGPLGSFFCIFCWAVCTINLQNTEYQATSCHGIILQLNPWVMWSERAESNNIYSEVWELSHITSWKSVRVKSNYISVWRQECDNNVKS